MENKKSRWLLSILIPIALLLVVYALGVNYASHKFLPNTSIGGIDVSGMTSDEANEIFKSQELVIDVEQRTPKGETVTERIDLVEVAEAALNCDTSALLNSQDKFLWFKSLFNESDLGDVDVNGSFDTDKLKTAIAGLYSQNEKTAVLPKDAHIEIDGKTVKIVPDEAGSVVDNKIAVERILAAAEAAVRGEGNQTVSLSDACKEPEIKADNPDLLAEKKMLEDVFAKKITVAATSDSAWDIDGEEVFDLLDIQGKEKSVNGDKLYALVEEITNYYYVNNYEYIYFDDLIGKLEEAILSDEPNPVVEASWYINYPKPEPTTTSATSASSSGTSSGAVSSYIEVSISQQTLYYYENGELIFSSPVVTGQTGESDTPTGYYTILNKVANTRLRGPTWDEFVYFWMPIDNRGYGLHDAPWRDAFGGDIYMNDGSHGCINLPYDTASRLFNAVQVGVTQVYIHY